MHTILAANPLLLLLGPLGGVGGLASVWLVGGKAYTIHVFSTCHPRFLTNPPSCWRRSTGHMALAPGKVGAYRVGMRCAAQIFSWQWDKREANRTSWAIQVRTTPCWNPDFYPPIWRGQGCWWALVQGRVCSPARSPAHSEGKREEGSEKKDSSSAHAAKSNRQRPTRERIHSR